MVRILNEGAVINASYAEDTEYVINCQDLTSLSVYNKYTVAPSTAKTFITGVKAAKVIQDITYTAVSGYGDTGNAITIAYTAGATAGAEVVTVTGSAITVQIATGVSTATQVKAAWDAKAEAVALATAAITGTGSNAQVVAAAAALTGGTGEVDIDNELVKSTAHGFRTGRKIALTTSSALPTGLTATNYWMIRVSDDTLKFASSLSNAIAGTAVNITALGTGTHTMTPAALSACTVKLQESNNGTDWDDVSTMSSTITATGASKFKPADVSMKYMKIAFAIGDGQVELVSTICGKG